MTKKRKPVSTATRERRRHQKLRDELWRRIKNQISTTRYQAGQNSLSSIRTFERMDEAQYLLDALRETGAK